MDSMARRRAAPPLLVHCNKPVLGALGRLLQFWHG
jgi:hypothetical protein